MSLDVYCQTNKHHTTTTTRTGNKVKVPQSGNIMQPLKGWRGNSLAIQWLGLSVFIARGPGRGTKILKETRGTAKKTKKAKKKKRFGRILLKNFTIE